MIKSGQEKGSYWWVVVVFSVLVLIGFVYFLGKLYFQAIGNPFLFNTLWDGDSPRSALGAFGDYFGGMLNPIFAFLSFIALLWTLKLNQEELAETRKELARAATAQEDSRRIMDEQLKTQFLQQFDSLFFALSNQLTNKIEMLLQKPRYKVTGKVNAPTRNDENFYFIAQSIEIFNSMNLKKSRIELMKYSELCSLFIFIYQILKNIDIKIEESELFDEKVKLSLKKNYSNIIRSLIPEQILQLLLINCYIDTNDHNFDRYKNLLTQFEFFEHISFYENNTIEKTSLLLSASIYYESKAFGQNNANLDFRKSLLFEEVDETKQFLIILQNILKQKYIGEICDQILIRGLIDFEKWESFIIGRNELLIDNQYTLRLGRNEDGEIAVVGIIRT